METSFPVCCKREEKPETNTRHLGCLLQLSQEDQNSQDWNHCLYVMMASQMAAYFIAFLVPPSGSSNSKLDISHTPPPVTSTSLRTGHEHLDFGGTQTFSPQYHSNISGGAAAGSPPSSLERCWQVILQEAGSLAFI